MNEKKSQNQCLWEKDLAHEKITVKVRAPRPLWAESMFWTTCGLPSHSTKSPFLKSMTSVIIERLFKLLIEHMDFRREFMNSAESWPTNEQIDRLCSSPIEKLLGVGGRLGNRLKVEVGAVQMRLIRMRLRSTDRINKEDCETGGQGEYCLVNSPWRSIFEHLGRNSNGGWRL